MKEDFHFSWLAVIISIIQRGGSGFPLWRAIIWGRLFRNPRLWLCWSSCASIHTLQEWTTTLLFSVTMQLDATEEGFIFSMLYTVPRRYCKGLASCQRLLPSLRTSQLHTNCSPYTKLSVATETPILYLIPGIWDSALPSLETRQLLPLKWDKTPVNFHFSRGWMSGLLLFLWPLALGILLPIQALPPEPGQEK